MFESSVNSDGTQTFWKVFNKAIAFESSVNSDGTQTLAKTTLLIPPFESSVNSDGTQTMWISFFLRNSVWE